MQPPTSRAGGCFLTLCILAGLGIGIALRAPVTGAVFGTVAGAALALLVWLIDRRRSG